MMTFKEMAAKYTEPKYNSKTGVHTFKRWQDVEVWCHHNWTMQSEHVKCMVESDGRIWDTPANCIGWLSGEYDKTWGKLFREHDAEKLKRP